MEEVVKLIGNTTFNEVRFVGMWGMGGIGKTTIARAVYELIRGEFKVTCFVRNVRELSEKNGIVQLQKVILSDLNISSSDFSDVEDGRKVMANSLCNRKVLLVLDDVSEEIQLKNLAWKQDWFGPGSRIIITRRDIQLLNRHGIHGTYEVIGLGKKEAHHAFCLKAFKQDEPNEEYSKLCKEVVEYTQGLPLAIEVLGSYLYGRDVDFWHNTTREIRSGGPPEIHKALKISYDHLGPTEKNIFLDIACFFKGMKKDRVTDILKMCNVYVGIGSEIGSGIVTLIDKSLVTLDQDNKLEMHDLLQEMGRCIVFEESPNNPGKRSRLWSTKDIDQVLTNDMGTDAIQAITLSSSFNGAHWSSEAFSKTNQLKFLSLPAIKLPNGLNYLPRSLKVLHWNKCPLETLPLADQSYEVVEMKLKFSHIKQLWYGRKSLTMLKYLNLTRSDQLKQTPDLSAVPFLETLILLNCYRLVKVHPSLVHHKKLNLLDLSGCARLKTLPGKLKMSSLKELILSCCGSLETLPEFGECMKQLSKLSLEYTAIRKLPTSVGNLTGLERLKLCHCERLLSLPDSINQLKSLRILEASGCQKLSMLPSSVSGMSSLSILNLTGCSLSEESFPNDFCHLPSLTQLFLDRNPLASLPTNIQELPKLRKLSLQGCMDIRYLPELPSSIRDLKALDYGSLDVTQLIFLSRSCNIHASSILDDDLIYIKLTPASEFPSQYSINREDGNCVSLPHRDVLLLNKRPAVSLCFLLEQFDFLHDIHELSLALYWNGRRFATRKMPPEMGPGRYLYYLVLRNSYLSDVFQEGDLFQLLIEGGASNCAKILISAAKWMET